MLRTCLLVLVAGVALAGFAEAFPGPTYCPAGYYTVVGGDLPYRVLVPPGDTAGVSIGPIPVRVMSDVWFAFRADGRTGGLNVRARLHRISGDDIFATVNCRWNTLNCGESPDYGCRLRFGPSQIIQSSRYGSDGLMTLLQDSCAFASIVPSGCYLPMGDGVSTYGDLCSMAGVSMFLEFRNFSTDTASVHAVWVGYVEQTTVGADVAQLNELGFAASPNPARGGTALYLTLPRAGPVKINLFDVSGRKVVSVVNTTMLPAGQHSFRVGPEVRSGVYLAMAQTELGLKTTRLVLLH